MSNPLDELPDEYRDAITESIDDPETQQLVAQLLGMQLRAREQADDHIRQHEVEEVLDELTGDDDA